MNTVIIETIVSVLANLAITLIGVAGMACHPDRKEPADENHQCGGRRTDHGSGADGL